MKLITTQSTELAANSDVTSASSLTYQHVADQGEIDMSKFLKFLGYAWAAPVTLFGLLYVALMTVGGFYKWHGVEGDALVWTVKPTSPSWLMALWKKWGGQAIGNVVVLKVSPVDRPMVLIHEQKHVDQVMRLGIFQPIMYALCYVAIRVGCPGSDPYWSSPFEVDARRHAGQLVDVEGLLKKLKETGKS